jgi:hypothetical protein
VVDSNGEPRVVYHGTKKGGFSVFDVNKIGENTHNADIGFFFIDTYQGAKSYSGANNKNSIQAEPISTNYTVFLNLKNPKYIFWGNGKYQNSWEAKVGNFNGIKEFIKSASEENYDGAIIEGVNDSGEEDCYYDCGNIDYIAFNSNQIKLADGTNTTFDPNNDDIRFEKGGNVITNPTEIECHRCDWKWKVKDGGDDLFICHKCNYDNSKYYKFSGIKGQKLLKSSTFGNGGLTVAKTLAPKSEQIYGSSKNPKKSSSDSISAEKIQFDKKTLDAIKNKVAKHNEEHPNKKVTIASAKAVVRRGLGAYSSSHRPTISSGKPNSRVAWGLARLNAFLYKVVEGESKSRKYSQDNDLLDELGIAHEKFKTGGTTKNIPKKKRMGDCYLVAGQMAMGTFYKNKYDSEFIGTPYLVHAEVVGQGAIEGIRYGHAWVEDDVFVYDFSNGRELTVPKALYYQMGQIIKQQPKYFRYTFEEATKKMVETKHYGSWDLITKY